MTARPLFAGLLFPLTLSLSLSLSLGLSLGGCAKQRECTEAIDKINTAATRLEKIANGVDDSDIAKTAEMSETLAKAANEEAANLAKVTVTTEELKGDYEAYIKMVKEAATAAEQLAVAAKGAASLLKKLESTEKEVNTVMEAFKKACAKGQPECAAVSEVLVKAPTATDEAKLAAGLRDWVKRMDALDPKDAAVKASVDDLKKVLSNQADFMEKAQKVQRDAEAAAKALDKAVAPEDKLIDAMNKTCGAA